MGSRIELDAILSRDIRRVKTHFVDGDLFNMETPIADALGSRSKMRELDGANSATRFAVTSIDTSHGFPSRTGKFSETLFVPETSASAI